MKNGGKITKTKYPVPSPTSLTRPPPVPGTLSLRCVILFYYRRRRRRAPEGIFYATFILDLLPGAPPMPCVRSFCVRSSGLERNNNCQTAYRTRARRRCSLSTPLHPPPPPPPPPPILLALLPSSGKTHPVRRGDTRYYYCGAVIIIVISQEPSRSAPRSLCPVVSSYPFCGFPRSRALLSMQGWPGSHLTYCRPHS